MQIFPKIGALCLITLLSAGALTAQEETVSKPDIVRLIGELPNFSTIREDMEALGFRGEKLELAVGQITRMLKDPLIANNIADRVIAARQTTVNPANAEGLFWPLVDRGLGHLSAREMKYFYQVEQTILKALSARNCGLVIKEKLSAERLAKVTGSVAARLNTASLKEYYRIQLKAARFGASRDAVRLRENDETRAVKAINLAVNKQLEGRDDAASVRRAYRDLNRVSNRRACDAGRLFMDAVLSMEGRDLHLALILLSTP